MDCILWMNLKSERDRYDKLFTWNVQVWAVQHNRMCVAAYKALLIRHGLYNYNDIFDNI